MKQFTFTSQLAPIIWKYLESRQNEGYTSVHCGYYMQELDCLSKELSDAPVVTKELIDAWDLLKPYLSNRSKIVRHNAIRAFAKFAYTQDGISYVPDTSKLKNSSTFTPHIFTVEEIRRLLYAADNLPVRNNAPTRHLVIPAVIRLLYCCGFRIGEVLRLRVKDVDLDTGIITVHNGKGGKDRLVPVHNSVIEYLRSYSAQLPDEREWFFPSACGHYSIKTIRSFHSDSQSQMIPLFYNAKKQALSRYGVTYILKKYAAKASPVLEPQNISPHVLRHTKAMHLLRAGVNMIYIRDFLGHADISTTEVYARIDAEMKRKVFEEKVPNYTPNTTMPWEEDEDLLQWLTQFGKKTF